MAPAIPNPLVPYSAPNLEGSLRAPPPGGSTAARPPYGPGLDRTSTASTVGSPRGHLVACVVKAVCVRIAVLSMMSTFPLIDASATCIHSSILSVRCSRVEVMRRLCRASSTRRIPLRRSASRFSWYLKPGTTMSVLGEQMIFVRWESVATVTVHRPPDIVECNHRAIIEGDAMASEFQDIGACHLRNGGHRTINWSGNVLPDSNRPSCRPF